jgi:hypothetical protein
MLALTPSIPYKREWLTPSGANTYQMKTSFRAICIAALLVAATFAHADIDHSSAEGLVHKSGLWEQLGGLSPQVEAGVQQAIAQGGKAPAASEKARIARVVQAAYAADRLRSVSTSVIASRMQAQHLNALRQWFDSPVGKSITRAEEATASEQHDPRAAFNEGAALLKSMPAERRKLLQDLLTATHTAEAIVQITISTAVAVQAGVASVTPNMPGPSANQLRADLEAQTPQMLEGFSNMALATFARAYSKISSEQLRQYVAFIRTPAGTAFNDAAFEALAAALTDAATQMGRSLPGTRDSSNT